MFYGASVWDPWMILAQILGLQCLYYASLAVALYVLVGTHVPVFGLKYFFDYRTLSPGSFDGWCTVLAFAVSAGAGAGYLLILVERAKKCLDFTATLYIIHTICCTLYGGLPLSIFWWLFHGASLVGMAVLGEWLCMRREMREIPIRSTSGGSMRGVSNGPGRTTMV